jgi:hypothetical protein
MTLQALNRFLDKEVRLQKIDIKRESLINVGHSMEGDLSLFHYKNSKGQEDGTGLLVSSGWRYLRTSPVVKIIDETETSIVVETDGGFYKLETMTQNDTVSNI